MHASKSGLRHRATKPAFTTKLRWHNVYGAVFEAGWRGRSTGTLSMLLALLLPPGVAANCPTAPLRRSVPRHLLQGCAHRHSADIVQVQRLPTQRPVPAGKGLFGGGAAGPRRCPALLGVAQGPAAPALLCCRAADGGGCDPRRRLLRRGRRFRRGVCVGDAVCVGWGARGAL